VTKRETALEGAFRYLAFGLSLASQVELPELPRIAEAVEPDVEIRFGAVEASLAGGAPIEPGVTATSDSLLIDYDPARFLVREGREIIVSPKPGGSDRDIRAYLLGSAMGAIFHQRGLLPLHANAIEVGGQAVAFAGPSGAGKSTLAAYFRERGYRVLCDDVCVVSFGSSGEPLAWPGIPRIKLWGDALAAFGRGVGDLERVFDGEDKFSLPLLRDPPKGPIPLARVYVLETTDAGCEPTIRSVTGARAFDAIMSNVYRLEFAAPIGKSGVQFANVVSVLNSTQVFSAERAWGFDIFHAEAEALEQQFEQVRGARRIPPGPLRRGRTTAG